MHEKSNMHGKLTLFSLGLATECFLSISLRLSSRWQVPSQPRTTHSATLLADSSRRKQQERLDEEARNAARAANRRARCAAAAANLRPCVSRKRFYLRLHVVSRETVSHGRAIWK